MTPPAPHYAVQILLPEPAALDPVVVHGQLRAWHADVQLIGGAAGAAGAGAAAGAAA